MTMERTFFTLQYSEAGRYSKLFSIMLVIFHFILVAFLTYFANNVFIFSLMMVKMLMGCKTLNLSEKNLQGQNAAHVAAMHDRLDILKYLVHKHEERFPHQNFDQDGPLAVDNKGMVPIHYAVLRNNLEMVRFLLEHKADEVSIGEYKKIALTRKETNLMKKNG